jgi:hypothetical protein
MPDYGLTGIHDELEYIVRADVAPDSISDAEIMARRPSAASGAALLRRWENRSRRKTWRVT